MSDQKKDPTNVDLDDFLDLDFGVKPNNETGASTATPAPESKSANPQATGGSTLSKTIEEKREKVLSSKEELELEFANSKAKSASTAPVLDFETTNNDEPAPATTTKKSGLGGVFGKKDNTNQKAKATGGLFGKKTKNTDGDLGLGVDTSAKKTAKKTPMALIIGGVVMLLLIGALVFVLFSDSNPEPVTPPPTPAPQPTTQAPPPPTPSEAVPPTTDAPAPTTEQQSIIPSTLPEINPDEILKAEIPEDPALLKEEIDRLSDTESQLAEQSKLIKEQLDLMNELTKAKDEEIAILEAQIAELEKQKSGK
ncbi:hypothetical protein [Moraxella oblonga]|uniref:hypothetical protein n=1 Tax=Moraxella oblonga TaxID=200413 RepID=UPI0008349FE7|nr:hypothetical protein [Moraxella oblonga]